MLHEGHIFRDYSFFSKLRKHFYFVKLLSVFIEIIGVCHLVLLIGTLICTLFILFVLQGQLTTLESNTADSQEMLEAITETLSPLRFIGAVGNICFGLTIVIVIRGYFEITWLKAFCSVVIPYVTYWLLSKALQSVFSF